MGKKSKRREKKQVIMLTKEERQKLVEGLKVNLTVEGEDVAVLLEKYELGKIFNDFIETGNDFIQDIPIGKANGTVNKVITVKLYNQKQKQSTANIFGVILQ